MTLTRISLACAFACALAGCGGGGGSVNSAEAVTSTTRTLDGYASKGLIRDGIVNVYSYAADGTRTPAPILSTRTSKIDGSYRLNLGARTGLFTVEVSADSSTTMDDEYSGTIAMPAGMTMRGLLQLDAHTGTTVKGYVTPFTDMLVNAATSAGANGTLTPANAAHAQTEVTKILGFNPLTTKPLNANTDAAASSADVSEKLQAVALAAISRIAFTNGVGCAGNAGEKIKCTVTATTGSATMKDGAVSISSSAKDALLVALAATAKDAEVNKTSLKTLDGQTLFVEVATNAIVNTTSTSSSTSTSTSTTTTPTTPTATTPTTTTPTTTTPTTTTPTTPTTTTPTTTTQTTSTSTTTPTTTSGLAPNPVADAKALFASLRTNMQAWTDVEKGGGLSSRSAAFKADFEAAIAPVDQDLADWAVVSAHGVKLFSDFVTGKSTAVSVEHGTNAGDRAACSLFKDVAATALMTPADVHLRPQSIYCFVSKKAIPNTVHATSVANQYTRNQVSKTMLLKPASGTTFDYEARTLIEKQQYSRVGNGREFNSTILAQPLTVGQVATGNITYAMGANIVSSVSINGYMPARVDTSGLPYTDRESWNVRFVTSEANGGVHKYALSGQITALKGGSALGSVSLNDGTYIKLKTNNGKQRITEVKLALTVASPTSKAEGTLSLSHFSADKWDQGYGPNKLQFTGVFTNPSAEYFKGVFAVEIFNYDQYDSNGELTETNFATGSVSFTGTVKISGRPALTLSLAGRETGYKQTEFNGGYDDGSNAVSIAGNNARPAVVDIASATGISIKLQEGNIYADIMKNDDKVGYLNISTGVINYIDGSFESLK